MLLQLDGSYHVWLEERGPYGVFREREDTHGYFMLLQGIIDRHGIPLGVYTDRHSVFQSPDQRLEGDSGTLDRTPTQWGRALRELGVTQVFAHSPEAKGRVERANGTFREHSPEKRPAVRPKTPIDQLIQAQDGRGDSLTSGAA